MSQAPSTPGMIPIRSLKIRGRPALYKEGRQTACPQILIGDATAFAFYLPDRGLGPSHRPGSIMYCTRFRDPGAGDVALLTDKEGCSIVRIVTNVIDEGYDVLHFEDEVEGQFKAVHDVVAFDDLSAVANVVATARFTI